MPPVVNEFKKDRPSEFFQGRLRFLIEHDSMTVSCHGKNRPTFECKTQTAVQAANTAAGMRSGAHHC
jgi:hypothetical protein